MGIKAKFRNRNERENGDEKTAERFLFGSVCAVTDTSPGCRSNHRREEGEWRGIAADAVAVAGKMNPGVPYKRPIV